MVSGLSLLAVHAHPDDETVSTGGTLARYSAEGVRTVLVTCTDGDLGEVLDPGLVGQDVATVRSRELEAARAVLGVSRLVRLGYLDSGMAGWPENHRPGAFFAVDVDKAVARLLAVIDEERPDVVLTYDDTGGYGHPDHLKAHEVVMAAMRRIQSHRPRLYLIRFPLKWSRAFVRALRESGIDAPGSAPSGSDAGPDVAEIGVPDDLVTTTIDTRGFIERKLEALTCYRSQMPPEHFLRRMPRALAERFWASEFFSTETNPAPRFDLFGD